MPIPALRAAHQPVNTFVATPASASSRAGRNTGGISLGSVCRPKKTKNTAAKRSRSGVSTSRAPSATGPDTAMPTRNAPTAADTRTCWAAPATSRASPISRNSRISLLGSAFGLWTSRLTCRPYRNARTRTQTSAASATSSVTDPWASVWWASSAVRMGRYTAMARSSRTSTDSTTGVSRLPIRPRSVRTLAMIPEDEIAVTPPRTTAASGPQPSRNAAATPGRALSVRSSAPVGACRRRPSISSCAVYSRPSVSSSRTTPISAPTSMNSSLAPSGNSPPCPKASPPSR